ncbi:MAG: TusE/DsrC/DsvC family sulfur relay protein [Acidiferrobacterales bacterium]
MSSLIDAIRQGEEGVVAEPGFPHAPPDWTKQTAIDLARQEDLTLGADHWTHISALQEYYAKHQDGPLHTHELHDALDEKFHSKGGIRYLYQLFPGGPVAQGCRIAGLKAPAGTIDLGFGSVV